MPQACCFLLTLVRFLSRQLSMIIYKRGPFEIEQMKLKQQVYIGVKSVSASFEHEIVWCKESETKILYMHGGEVIKEGPCFNDFYGFMTSKSQAMIDAKRAMKFYSITKNSSLKMELVTTVKRIPLIKAGLTTDISDHTKRYEFKYVPSSWSTEDGKQLSPVVVSEEIEVLNRGSK